MIVQLGDGLAGMQALEPGSVDLVLADLPSGETRAKFDTPVDLVAMWPRVWRALKPTGKAVLFASSLRFAAKVQQSSPAFRYDLILKKSIATGFLNSKERPLRDHEFMLVFYQRRGTYNPQMTEGHAPIHAAHRTSHGENYGPIRASEDARGGATDRYPRSVLAFPSVGTSSPTRKHPQQKSPECLRWCIRTYSNPGELVVDFCSGSGSTGLAAEAEGRRALCWDIDPRFGRAP